MPFLEKKNLLLPIAACITAALILNGVQNARAVTETNVSRSIELNRYRVSSLDVKNSQNANDPVGACGGLAKRVTVMTVAAGGEINSIVTKARTAFAGPNVAQIGVIAVRAEQNGVQLSNGDIAMPATDLTDTNYIENRIPASGEYAFYDQNDPWNVVAYVCGQDANSNPTDISNLTQGSVDFYISVTK